MHTSDRIRRHAAWFPADGKVLILSSFANMLMSSQIVDSACGDRTVEIHQANMFDMNAKNGDVVSEDEAISKLEAGW